MIEIYNEYDRTIKYITGVISLRREKLNKNEIREQLIAEQQVYGHLITIKPARVKWKK